jgi:hypothetical protein
MKLFLIVYDRDRASLSEMKEYDSSQRDAAEKDRFERELRLSNEGARYEIVLIETTDQRTLKKTHRRYFRSVRDIANTSSRQTS